MRLQQIEKEQLHLMICFAEILGRHIEVVTKLILKTVNETPPGGAGLHSVRRFPPAGGRAGLPSSGEFKG